jgi:hypothetical protein
VPHCSATVAGSLFFGEPARSPGAFHFARESAGPESCVNSVVVA